MYEIKEKEKETEIDCQLYIPRLLHLRLTRREILKTLCWLNIFINISLFIFGFIFLDTIWNTRSYIYNGNEFWDSFKVKDLKENQIQLHCSFAAIITISSSFFIEINNIVLLYHAHYGGLKIRIKLAQWTNKILQGVLFIYSIIPVATFNSILIIFPVYFAFSLLAEISSIFIFILCGKVFRKELDYMLPLEVLYKHKEEYYQEYLTKKKVKIENREILESAERRLNSNVNNEQVDNNRVFIN
jgi:hypothetical protein